MATMNNKEKKEEGSHSHSHSHSILGGHSHSHSEGGSQIVDALQGKGDAGSRITLIGLYSNIILTLSKGLAGYFLHSASLLADAAHSFSDLIGDIVTLICWKLSRKSPTASFPYGYGKYETLGTTTISLLLIGGALGIGAHSYGLLMQILGDTAANLPDGTVLQEILTNVTEHAPAAPASHGHSHAHDLVDPNAAWFALLSIVAKEWLYQATAKVARSENSHVLMANAIHHRSDAYSSVVALAAILGSWAFPQIPLDPLGGLTVSVVILVQGVGLVRSAWGDLMDRGVETTPLREIAEGIQGVSSVQDARARRAGSRLLVDMTVNVPATRTVKELEELEDEISKTILEKKKDVAEVRVTFRAEHS